MLRVFIIMVLLANVSGFGQQRDKQTLQGSVALPPPSPPRPKPGKLTPIPCKQLLRAQVELADKQSSQIRALEREKQAFVDFSASLQEENQKLSARNEELIALYEKQQKTDDELSKKHKQLTEEALALAAVTAADEVSGRWTIQTVTGPVVCYVQVYQSSRTIQLTNCH